MDSRGEKQFIKFPKVAAKLYDYMISGYSTKAQTNEIAQYLASRINNGKLLDVGTGPGRLLIAINQFNPNIELYGLDISESMIKQAKENLSNVSVDLRLGNIMKTEYKDNFFDIIASTGSFYLWDNPENCIEEIGRILNANGSVYIFETYKDHNKSDYKNTLKQNLKKENIPRRLFAPYFLNKQLNMTYKFQEIESIVNNTSFKNSYTINKIKLGGLPIWLRIELKKHSA